MLSEEYKTGNKRIDALVELQLAKEEHHLNRTMFSKLQLDQAHNKYHVARKEDRTHTDGTVFASKKEMLRWDELLKLQKAGFIKDLERQVPFVLQEEFISKQWGDVQPITYVADFVYTNIKLHRGVGQRKIVEDSKGGILTDVYKLKKKLFLYKYGSYLFYEV